MEEKKLDTSTSIVMAVIIIIIALGIWNENKEIHSADDFEPSSACDGTFYDC